MIVIIVQLKPEDGKKLLRMIEDSPVYLEDNLKEAEAIDEALGRDGFRECSDLVQNTKNTTQLHIEYVVKEWLQSHGFDVE